MGKVRELPAPEALLVAQAMAGHDLLDCKSFAHVGEEGYYSILDFECSPEHIQDIGQGEADLELKTLPSEYMRHLQGALVVVNALPLYPVGWEVLASYNCTLLEVPDQGRPLEHRLNSPHLDYQLWTFHPQAHANCRLQGHYLLLGYQHHEHSNHS